MFAINGNKGRRFQQHRRQRENDKSEQEAEAVGRHD